MAHATGRGRHVLLGHRPHWGMASRWIAGILVGFWALVIAGIAVGHQGPQPVKVVTHTVTHTVMKPVPGPVKMKIKTVPGPVRNVSHTYYVCSN